MDFPLAESTEVTLAIGPVVGGIIAAAVPTLLAKLFPDKRQQQLDSAGRRVADADAASIEQDTRLRQEIERMIGGLAEGGRPPTFRLDLRNPQDIDELLQGIAPTAELEALFRLLGAGRPGSGSGIAATQQATALQRDREGQLSDLARDLLTALGSREKKVDVAPTPLPPPGTGATDF